MSFEVLKIVSGSWNTNSYLVNEIGESILIDPGSGYDEILHTILDRNLKVIGIVNTHAHFDHIASVEALKKELKTEFFLHSGDLKLLKRANLYRTIFGSTGFVDIPNVDYLLDKQPMPLELGHFRIEVMHTPGHTSGSVCLLIEDHLFTGDLLFKGEIGRTDLPGGNSKQMRQSLNQLAKLPPEIKVFPGHGDSTTMGKELETNSKYIREINWES